MVERDDRSPVATFHTAAPLSAASAVELSESAAHHARVKRLEADDRIQLTDGSGTVALGRLSSIDKRRVTVDVEQIRRVSAPSAIHLRVPIGDRDRMLWLAEKATELGVTTWQAVRFRRSMSVSPRGEGAAFAAKVEARMISALEQSGGAWLPRRLDDCALDDIDVPAGSARILLDRDGAPLLGLAGADSAVVLFGPEGGLEPAELSALDAGDWQRASLAGNTLRFETAGIAAVAVVRAVRLNLQDTRE
jgi:16S rRNA (uracil1498-N3)-methyltransferase